jgi:hypothetical protein
MKRGGQVCSVHQSICFSAILGLAACASGIPADGGSSGGETSGCLATSGGSTSGGVTGGTTGATSSTSGGCLDASYPWGAQKCGPGCTVDDDCADPSTSCQGGICIYAACGGYAYPDGGANGEIGGPCLSGQAPGTCLFTAIYTTIGATCLAAGTAMASCNPSGCDPSASRAQHELLCGVGFMCVDGSFLGKDAGVCMPACTSTDGTGCPSGQVCAVVGDGQAVVCFPRGGGGCAEGLIDDGAACNNNASCGCPHTCTSNGTYDSCQ